MWIVGALASHGEPFFEDLLDVAILAKARPRQACLKLVGDWNCDLLRDADLGKNEFRHDERNWEDRIRMDAIKSLADESHLEIQGPQEIIFAAGGPWGELSAVVPMTRIPAGEHSDYVFPTCLDWAMCEADQLLKFQVHWRTSPGDHAICVAECEWNVVMKPRPKNKFRARDWEYAVEWLKDALGAITEELTYDKAVSVLNKMADACEDRASCAERRMARVPFEVRQLWRRASDARQEQERQHLRRLATDKLRKFIADKNVGLLEKCVRRGAMPMKTKALKTIRSMTIDDAEGTSTPE